jgi:hypothetical protein
MDLDFDADDVGQELSRVAVLSAVTGRWQVGMCLIDADGCAVALLWKRSFESCEEAERGLSQAR